MGTSQTKQEQQSTKPFDATKVFALICAVDQYDALNLQEDDAKFEEKYKEKKAEFIKELRYTDRYLAMTDDKWKEEIQRLEDEFDTKNKEFMMRRMKANPDYSKNKFIGNEFQNQVKEDVESMRKFLMQEVCMTPNDLTIMSYGDLLASENSKIPKLSTQTQFKLLKDDDVNSGLTCSMPNCQKPTIEELGQVYYTCRYAETNCEFNCCSICYNNTLQKDKIKNEIEARKCKCGQKMKKDIQLKQRNRPPYSYSDLDKISSWRDLCPKLKEKIYKMSDENYQALLKFVKKGVDTVNSDKYNKRYELTDKERIDHKNHGDSYLLNGAYNERHLLNGRDFFYFDMCFWDGYYYYTKEKIQTYLEFEFYNYCAGCGENCQKGANNYEGYYCCENADNNKEGCDFNQCQDCTKLNVICGLTCIEGEDLQFRTTQTLSRMDEIDKLLQCSLCQKKITNRMAGYYTCRNADKDCNFICCSECFRGEKPKNKDAKDLIGITCTNGSELIKRRTLGKSQPTHFIKGLTCNSEVNREFLELSKVWVWPGDNCLCDICRRDIYKNEGCEKGMYICQANISSGDFEKGCNYGICIECFGDKYEKKKIAEIEESDLPFKKLEENIFFPFLTSKDRKKLVPQTQIKTMKPSQVNFQKYLDGIKSYALANPDQKVLSLYFFSCYGAVDNGQQVLLLNKQEDNKLEQLKYQDCLDKTFEDCKNTLQLVVVNTGREQLTIVDKEKKIRNLNKKKEKEFEDSLGPSKDDKKENWQKSSATSNWDRSQITVYGVLQGQDQKKCADNKLVKSFLELLPINQNEEKRYRITDALNQLRVNKAEIQVTESPGCPPLTIQGLNHLVGTKFLIVVQDSVDQKLESSPALQHAVEFFKSQMHFEDKEVLYLKAEEIKIIDAMYDGQNRHPNLHDVRNPDNYKKLKIKLSDYASKTITKKRQGALQTATVFLFGTDLSGIGNKEFKNVKNFFDDRNMELGLLIDTENVEKVKEYFKNRTLQIQNENLPLKFESRPKLFPQEKFIVEWMYPKGFKNGKDFQYLIPKCAVDEKKITLKENFDFFESPPARVLEMETENSIGCVISEKQVLIVKLKDEDLSTFRLPFTEPHKIGDKKSGFCKETMTTEKLKTDSSQKNKNHCLKHLLTQKRKEEVITHELFFWIDLGRPQDKIQIIKVSATQTDSNETIDTKQATKSPKQVDESLKQQTQESFKPKIQVIDIEIKHKKDSKLTDDQSENQNDPTQSQNSDQITGQVVNVHACPSKDNGVFFFIIRKIHGEKEVFVDVWKMNVKGELSRKTPMAVRWFEFLNDQQKDGKTKEYCSKMPKFVKKIQEEYEKEINLKQLKAEEKEKFTWQDSFQEDFDPKSLRKSSDGNKLIYSNPLSKVVFYLKMKEGKFESFDDSVIDSEAKEQWCVKPIQNILLFDTYCTIPKTKDQKEQDQSDQNLIVIYQRIETYNQNSTENENKQESNQDERIKSQDFKEDQASKMNFFLTQKEIEDELENVKKIADKIKESQNANASKGQKSQTEQAKQVNTQLDNNNGQYGFLQRLEEGPLEENIQYLQIVPIKECTDKERHITADLCNCVISNKLKNSRFYIVLTKNEISLLSAERKEIFPLIRQKIVNKNDFLENIFLSGQLPHSVTLHYFEQSHELNGGTFKARTYNSFTLHQDFLTFLQNYKGIVPSSRQQVIEYYKNSKIQIAIQDSIKSTFKTERAERDSQNQSANDQKLAKQFETKYQEYGNQFSELNTQIKKLEEEKKKLTEEKETFKNQAENYPQLKKEKDDKVKEIDDLIQQTKSLKKERDDHEKLKNKNDQEIKKLAAELKVSKDQNDKLKQEKIQLIKEKQNQNEQFEVENDSKDNSNETEGGIAPLEGQEKSGVPKKVNEDSGTKAAPDNQSDAKGQNQVNTSQNDQPAQQKIDQQLNEANAEIKKLNQLSTNLEKEVQTNTNKISKLEIEAKTKQQEAKMKLLANQNDSELAILIKVHELSLQKEQNQNKLLKERKTFISNLMTGEQYFKIIQTEKNSNETSEEKKLEKFIEFFQSQTELQHDINLTENRIKKEEEISKLIKTFQDELDKMREPADDKTNTLEQVPTDEATQDKTNYEHEHEIKTLLSKLKEDIDKQRPVETKQDSDAKLQHAKEKALLQAKRDYNKLQFVALKLREEEQKKDLEKKKELESQHEAQFKVLQQKFPIQTALTKEK